MKVLLQRVTRASVTVDGRIIGSIGKGLVVFAGVAINDTKKDAKYLAQKVANLRIFSKEDKFDLSALDIHGDLLIVSQFTLLANSRKGRRPSFTDAAPPAEAEEIFNYFVEQARSTGLKVEIGRFQAHMDVEIHNDGPVTIILDSTYKL